MNKCVILSIECKNDNRAQREGNNMAKLNFEVVRKERLVDLMNEFFDMENKFREAVARGGLFIDCHEWQIHAANAIHQVEDEGLLHMAKEMYPHEAELMKDYLDVYNEIQSGARI